MGGTICHAHIVLQIVLRALVLVPDKHTDGGTDGDAVRCQAA